MLMNVNKELYIYWATMLLVIGLLLLIPQLRIAQNMPAPFLEETYATLNQANPEGTPFFQLMHALLASPYSSLWLTILPLLISLLTLLILYALVGTREEALSFLTGIILALTPAFLAGHLSLTVSSLILFFVALTTYLHWKKSYLSALSILALFLVNPLSGILIGLFVAVENFRQKRKVFGCTLAVLLVAASIIWVGRYEVLLGVTKMGADTIFSFFGAELGYTLFLVLLGLTGIGLRFYQGKQTRFLWMAISLILVGTIYSPLRLVAVALLAYYAAVAFLALAKYSYLHKELGQYTLLLFICIFLFATITFIKGALVAQPSAEQAELFTWIGNAQGEGGVFVHPSLKEVSTYFSNRPVFTSDEFVEVLALRDYQAYSTLLQEQHIRFILIDQQIRNVLERDEQGILFILENNNRFEKVYSSPAFQLYVFTPSTS